MALIHLDAGVVIGFLDANDGHHRAATEALGDSLQSGDDLAVAASAFAECLVGPSRRGVDAVRVVTDLFERLPIRVVDLGEDVALRAAALRAKHGALRLPDALVIATAVCDGAHRLITTDRRRPTARKLGLDVEIVTI